MNEFDPDPRSWSAHRGRRRSLFAPAPCVSACGPVPRLNAAYNEQRAVRFCARVHALALARHPYLSIAALRLQTAHMPHLTSLTSQRASRHQSARHRAAYLQLAAARRAPRSSPLPPTQPSLQGTSCHPTRPPARTPQSSRTRSALPPFPLSPAHGRLADTAPCARHTTSTIYTLVVVL